MKKSFLYKNYQVRYDLDRTSIMFPNKTKYMWYILPSLSVCSCMSQCFLFQEQPAIDIQFNFLIFSFRIEIAHITDPVELARIKGEDWLRVAAQQGKEENI